MGEKGLSLNKAVSPNAESASLSEIEQKGYREGALGFHYENPYQYTLKRFSQWTMRRSNKRAIAFAEGYDEGHSLWVWWCEVRAANR